MDTLDMRTAVVGMVATFATCTAIAGALWYQSRERFNGMQAVAGGLGVSTASVLLIALRDLIPDLLSVSVANILLLAGSMIVLVGLERLVDRTRPKHAEIIVLIVYSAYCLYFAFDPVDPAFRILVNSLVLSVISGESAWLMLSGVERSTRKMTRDVGLAFAFLTAVHLARVAGVVVLGAGPTFMRSTPMDVVLIILHSAAVVAIMFSLALMLYRMLGTRLDTQEGILASAFRAAPYAMVLSRPADGTIFEANDALSDLTGYSHDEVVGRSSRELGMWGHWEDRTAVLADLRAGRDVAHREVEFRKRTGDTIIGMVSVEILEAAGGEYMVTSVVDVTERKRMEDEVRELSIRDQLTGLYNRRGFFAIVGHLMREAERRGTQLHLVFLDCDGLKALNDTRGHEEGDRALVSVAALLRETFRGSDIIARVGGDEFVVCFEESEDATAETVLARLEEAMGAGPGSEPGPRLDLSWGTAVLDPVAGDTIDDALARADARMYQHKAAKQDGR